MTDDTHEPGAPERLDPASPRAMRERFRHAYLGTCELGPERAQASGMAAVNERLVVPLTYGELHGLLDQEDRREPPARRPRRRRDP